MGAWIETVPAGHAQPFRAVAPLMGAWIETSARENLPPVPKSLPSWGRGLKLPGCDSMTINNRRSPRGGVD